MFILHETVLLHHKENHNYTKQIIYKGYLHFLKKMFIKIQVFTLKAPMQTYSYLAIIQLYMFVKYVCQVCIFQSHTMTLTLIRQCPVLNSYKLFSYATICTSFKWIEPLFFALSCTKTQTHTQLHTHQHTQTDTQTDMSIL